MKMNKSILGLTLCSALLFVACKKEDPQEEVNLSPIELTGNQTVDILLEDRIASSSTPDYVISGTYTIQAGVQIQPGTSIRMAAGASIIVEGSGSLKAVGTAASKIRFYGQSATPGFWNYIRFESNNANNILDYVIVEDGGGSANWNAAIYGYNNGRLSLSNAIIRNSAQSGVLIYTQDFNLLNCSNVTVTECAYDAVAITAKQMDAFDESLSASSNGFNRITVDGGDIAAPQVWKKTSVPFFIKNSIELNSSVEVQPGGDIVIGPNSNITVRTNGSLKAIGTVVDMIRFRGEQDIEGAWGYILFQTSNSANNEFQYCEVANGGSDANWDASIYLYDGARFRLGNSIVRNSYRYGLIDYQNANIFTDDGNNTFTGNLQGDIGN